MRAFSEFFLMKPFVRITVRPVKKKYRTRKILELKVALNSKMPSSRCLEKGSRSSDITKMAFERKEVNKEFFVVIEETELY